jgi:ATP-binding cassette subfamily A (ABC1) protein 3
MELQFRQLRTLVWKNLLLRFSGFGSRIGTVHTSITLPVIISLYLTFIIRTYFPSATYGIGNASSIDNLSDALGQRNNILVLMNNASSKGGAIDNVILSIAGGPQNGGRQVVITDSGDELRETCRSNFAGSSHCFAAAVFQSSPSEGPGGVWNYTIRADASLGSNNIDVTKDTNDVQINILPLQHAIDTAIANVGKTPNSTSLPSTVQDYLFTSIDEKQRVRNLVVNLVEANISAIAIIWLVVFLSVPATLVTIMAKERETEMSDLIESVMPNRRRWEPQAIRLAALHISFDIIYFISWVVGGVIFGFGYFKYTSIGISFISFILAGFAMTSFSILGGSFFKRAQLSGVIVIGVTVLLGVAAQITNKFLNDAGMVITSLLFMPMSFVNLIICICHWEHESMKVDLAKGPPNSHSGVPGITFIICFIIQIFIYPLLAAFVERGLYGTAVSRRGREISMEPNQDHPVIVSEITKTYQHSWLWGLFLRLFGKNTAPVIAVKGLNLSARKGQVMVLVGANGCGKSTTLNAIAGLHDVTSGKITVDGTGGIGICPQKNVLWNGLTVIQHAEIFNNLKTVDQRYVGGDLALLYTSCGLYEKLKSKSKNLSGGQKRKLQLLIMLTGGSQVCCVDEASGGLDPLSRRKIWDILLAERGKRTVILTTHFLDEAEFLADNMVIMAQGVVAAQGSVSELKHKLGNGYRVDVRTPTNLQVGEKLLDAKEKFDERGTFMDSADALEYIKKLEADGNSNYQIAGPTIEEVFMKLAADPESEYQEFDGDLHHSVSRASGKQSSNVSDLERHKVGAFKQIVVLLKKRWTVWRRNPFPLLLALLLPIIAAALLTKFLKSTNPGCDVADQFDTSDLSTVTATTFDFVVGPSTILNPNTLSLVGGLFSSGQLGDGSNATSLLSGIRVVDSLDQFNNYIDANFSAVIPGGFYAGDTTSPPTFAIRSDLGIQGIASGVLIQNVLDSILTGLEIACQYAPFDISFPTGTGQSLQFIVYFSLVFSAVPAFFTLYVNQERVRNVRAMEYSNGVRPLPLWTAYLLFDWLIFLASSVVVTIIFATTTSSAWFHIGYVFLILILYGLASILLAYLISKIAKSHFTAFAFCAAGQVVMFVIFLSTYWSIQTNADPSKIDNLIQIPYYAIGCISPVTQLLKGLFVGLNLFSILCVGSPAVKATNPAAFSLYGGPIFFLIVQSIIMFLFLLWTDYSFSLGPFRRFLRHSKTSAVVDPEKTLHRELEVVEEESRVVKSTTDGLRVVHISKSFKPFRATSIVAVDDLSFGVQSGEVFGLVGPNGAGKSTTISMLRGEISPNSSTGLLTINGIDVQTDRYAARFHLGVCPQFDAIDTLSVREHLAFYASIRGTPSSSVPDTVEAMLASVGLRPFSDRMASKLSGGNKRKLSLAMALIGNPQVVLLDEPSSGMDPVAKRNMWRTLARFRPGRSILLTTHSMEEADALANRVGVLATKLLDIGSTALLREKHGTGLHLHIVMASAPHTEDKEIEDLDCWIHEALPGIRREGIPYHGQVRYNIPVKSPRDSAEDSDKIGTANNVQELRSVGSVFVLLEENKSKLGIEFYSVSPSTFDEVFLKIVERHEVQEEEGVRERPKNKIMPWLRKHLEKSSS